MHYFKHGNVPKSAGVLIACGLLILVIVTFSQIFSSPARPVLFQTGNPGWTKGKLLRIQPYNLFTSRINTVVVTKLGEIDGTIQESRSGRYYFAFRNIPYAKPPINELRFKDPEPPEPWTGLRDGSKLGPQCIQREKHVDVLRSAGEEDCLYLNVYTPQCRCPTLDNKDPRPKFPVMVYIHGGGYNSGNGSRYGPDYFMDENVVLITFEFRLGAFGFISTDDDVIRGNMGFKDIIMLLRWVQENIERFGGDPGKVTVFGNSSGGVSVHTLLLSQMSKGLFQRAISQSGTLMRGGGSLPGGKPIVESIGKTFGCKNTKDSKELADCLRGVDSKELAIVQGPLVFYGPVQERIPENGTEADVFLSASTIQLINNVDNYPMRVPWLVGDVSAERLADALNLLRDDDKINALNENWVEESKTILEFRKIPSEEKLMKIRKFYFQRHNITNSTRSSLVNLYSDNSWVHGTKVAALAHAQHSPVYLYWLTREAAKSYASASMIGYDPPFGVTHADELQYLFLYDGYPEIPIGSTHARFSQKLIRNWVVFADTGKPEIAEWAPVNVTDNGERWFQLDDKTKFTSVLKYRIRFWDDYINEIYGS
ncbi:unnamed protein product [Allacma fusca]|uniref:Carboxylic ester hydrolase n=1 Tax=Allacma fusca TaxID=39272 RepID=A0A8J2LG26_9HEXA|nr:unnamed protein product [Allacma fusca]